MPLDIELEPGETLILDPMEIGFGVTDRAIFLPQQKRFAVDTNDQFVMRRVPKSDVVEVALRRIPPLLFPFVQGRFGLVIRMTRWTYKWKPPILLPFQKELIQDRELCFQMIADSSRKAGLPLVDERQRE